MTLSIQRSDRRDRWLCRFGVMLVVCSLVINMVAVPKAKAVVIDATAAFGAAAATAAINGTTATTLFTGMGTSAATGSVIGLMDTYAAATGVAASGTALASTIATGILVAGGTLLVGAAAAALIGGFIDWLRERGLQEDGEPLNFAPSDLYDYNGNVFPELPVSSYPYAIIRFFDNGSCQLTFTNKPGIHDGGNITFSSGTSYINYASVSAGVTSWGTTTYKGSWNSAMSLSFKSLWSNYDVFSKDGTLYQAASEPTSAYSDDAQFVPKPEFQEIPNEIPQGQVLSIDTGLSTLPQGDPQGAADAIMQSVIDGNFAPSVSLQADPSVQPDPDPNPNPDPGTDPDAPTEAPELPDNLGRLGKALTTRFPFSVPWDIARAVELLAAPAKAPYWEIDFMRPIAYRFGGLGDTTITIDLGQPEFEIIGITTRITSTIGFCLALAAATKRFIWS